MDIELTPEESEALEQITAQFSYGSAADLIRAIAQRQLTISRPEAFVALYQEGGL